MKSKFSSFATLIGLFVLLETAAWNGHVRLSQWEWLMVVLSASFAGRAIAYMTIGLPIRTLFVREQTHPTFGAYTMPRYDQGWKNILGELLSCPLCSGMWVGAALLLIWNFFPEPAYMTAQALSIGSVAAFISRLHELLESAKDYAWESAGLARQQALILKDERDIAEEHGERRVLPAVEMKRIHWETIH